MKTNTKNAVAIKVARRTVEIHPELLDAEDLAAFTAEQKKRKEEARQRDLDRESARWGLRGEINIIRGQGQKLFGATQRSNDELEPAKLAHELDVLAAAVARAQAQVQGLLPKRKAS